jgi:hypothetical protein
LKFSFHPQNLTQVSLPAADTDIVYRVSKGLRVLGACFLLPLIALCIAGPLWLLHGSSAPDELKVTLPLLAFFVAALFVYVLRSTLRTRLEFLASGIRYTSGWGRPRETAYDEIEGYRILQGRNARTLKLIPRDKLRKPVKIELVFERAKELDARLGEKFKNLDAADLQAEMSRILSDETLGASEDDRRASLEGARRQARVLNLAATALVFWGFIYPRPYDLVMTLLAAAPVLAIGLIRWSNGLVTFDGKRTSARPTVAYAAMVPAMVLGVRGLLDWHILAWSGFWTPFAVFAGTMIALAWFCAQSLETKKVGSIIALSFVFLAHSFGLVLFINGACDRSVPAIHRTVVVRRWTVSGRNTSYHFRVSPWIDGRGAWDMSVARQVYDQHEVGSPALIGVCRGSLSIPWFFVR